MDNSPYIETGEIVSTHGVRGEIKVYPWADSPEQLLRMKSFLIDGIETSVERSRIQGTCVLLKFVGIDTVESAQLLKGKVISFDKRKYPPAKGYYIADLIGISAYTDGNCIGTVKEVLQYPGNDVWVIQGKKEYLLPSVPEYVLSVDIAQRRAEVRLIEGMENDEN